jgi:single-strand DNA-binding protein
MTIFTKGMKMPYPSITAEGNLVDEVEVRVFNDKSCAMLRIACNGRKKNEQGEWISTEPIYLDASVWGKAAENTANLFKKGDAVVITGILKQRSYTTKDGVNRTVDEISIDTIAAPVKRY